MACLGEQSKRNARTHARSPRGASTARRARTRAPCILHGMAGRWAHESGSAGQRVPKQRSHTKFVQHKKQHVFWTNHMPEFSANQTHKSEARHSSPIVTLMP